MHEHSILHQFSEIITGTVGITCLVMVMMLLIEFVNVSSSGRLLSKLQKRPYLQIGVASLLGLIPGCIGGFTIVSLYTHRLLSFGALVAGMISTFGDSAFLLFAMSPRTVVPLYGSLFLIALVAGAVTEHADAVLGLIGIQETPPAILIKRIEYLHRLFVLQNAKSFLPLHP